jgi:DNA polymerase-1
MDFSQLEGVPAVTPQFVPKVPGRYLFVDADILCYQCGGNDDTDIETSRQSLKRKIDLFMAASGAERLTLGMTGPGSNKGHRAVIAYTKPYQGTRSGSKPKNWLYLRNYVQEGLAGPVKVVYDREADDLAGLFSTTYGDKAVLCSRDKDFRMLPGWHLDWDTCELVHVPREAFSVEAGGKVYGTKWFWTQMLTGDSADNIPGLPKHPQYPRGVGPVAAAKILAGVEDDQHAMHFVSEAYKDHYGEEWADRYVEQASLLWIRRTTEAFVDEWAEYLPVTVDIVDAADRLAERVAYTVQEAERITACQKTQ